jgi:CRP-like cAMP-binding protein
LESVAWTAFVVGLISACSLPLGALATSVWRPSDRSTAILMAFGGGALLAALTIDLVGSALDKGHFNALAVGAVLGGLIFVTLNRIVNDYGGFLRKASTTIYHLRRKEYQRLRRIARQLNRAELFHELTTRDYKGLAASVQTRQLSRGEAVFHAEDPAEALYIVTQGAVELYDRRNPGSAVARSERFALLGWRPCLIGTPHSRTAIAAVDSEIWVIPKSAIDALLLNSPEFQQVVHQVLRSPEMTSYLVAQHGMAETDASRWLDEATKQLVRYGRVPSALPVERREQDFCRRLANIRRFSLLQALPTEEGERIARHLIYKTYRRGSSFFHRGEPAERLFLIDQGQVSIVDPLASHGEVTQLQDDDAFGVMALMTGARHTTTAIADRDTHVWELRKEDLEKLLPELPVFAERFRYFVSGGEAARYLEHRQHVDADKTARWVRDALRNLSSAQLPPAASALTRQLHANKGAPLAIFLGITLDGIPESLVIGASLIHANLSLSLIVGLFLSNFPEALSSSIGMRQQGMSFARVVFMWTALMLITGLGAAAGSQFFIGASGNAYALVEGLAAGAMLTMIAETMLPEAYFKGGSVVGMSTLFGFLIAIFAKTLE